LLSTGNSKDGLLLERSRIDEIWRLVEPELAQLGYELIEVEIGRMGRSGVLRLFIDKEGGITLDDCTAATQLLDPVLDEHNFMDGNYVLEMSSPGFDRPLRRPRDFERFTGEPVKITTYSAVEGRKRFHGTLAGFADGMVQLRSGERQYDLHLENIKKAHLDR
jgi:ribosome maturation factor RimP